MYHLYFLPLNPPPLFGFRLYSLRVFLIFTSISYSLFLPQFFLFCSSVPPPLLSNPPFSSSSPLSSGCIFVCFVSLALLILLAADRGSRLLPRLCGAGHERVCGGMWEWRGEVEWGCGMGRDGLGEGV